MKNKINCSLRPFDCKYYKHEHLCSLSKTNCNFAININNFNMNIIKNKQEMIEPKNINEEKNKSLNTLASRKSLYINMEIYLDVATNMTNKEMGELEDDIKKNTRNDIELKISDLALKHQKLLNGYDLNITTDF